MGKRAGELGLKALDILVALVESKIGCHCEPDLICAATCGQASFARRVDHLLPVERIAMTCTRFAEGQVLFKEGDPTDSVFRRLRGAVNIIRELDGEPVLLGTVGTGQFIGEMGVLENLSCPP
jgi:CRP-like cAMP-binding protein